MKINTILPYETIRSSEINELTLIIPIGKEEKDDTSLVDIACDLLEIGIGQNLDMFG